MIHPTTSKSSPEKGTEEKSTTQSKKPVDLSALYKQEGAANHLIVKGNFSGLNFLTINQDQIDSFKRRFRNNELCEVDLFFEKLDTHTVKILFDLFKFLKLKVSHGANVKVIWRVYPEDIDMLQTGFDFAEIYNLNFTVVGK